MPACTVTVSDSRSSASTLAQAAHVERDHRRVLAAQRRDARRRRSCRRRTARPRASAARTARAAPRTCSWRAGIDDRVGRPLRLARAQAHEVGVALARRVRTRSAWSSRTPSAPSERAQLRAGRSASAAGARRTCASATGGRGRARRPDDLAQEAPAPAPAAPAAAPGSPQPHQRIAGTDRAQGPTLSQPLIRSRPSSASSSVARAARRTRTGRRGAGRSPCSAWRSSIVTSVAACRALAGCRRTSVTAEREQARERRALHLLGPAQRACALVGSDDVEVGAHDLALRGLHHLGERASSHVLDALHARPPARQVVGVADDLPQLLAGAAIVRLRRAVGIGAKPRTRR